MLGFPDPFSAVRLSVYSATAWTKAEVLVCERHELSHALHKCKHDDAVAMCRVIEKEYNQLMVRLKAKEFTSHSVADRAIDEKQAEEYRERMLLWRKQDFDEPSHLAYLDGRLTEIEQRLDAAAVQASEMRARMEKYVAPIAKTIFERFGKKYGAGRMLSQNGLKVNMRRTVVRPSQWAQLDEEGGDARSAAALAAAVLGETDDEKMARRREKTEEAQKRARDVERMVNNRAANSADNELENTAAIGSMLM